MDIQERDQIETTLRAQWDSLWPQILDRFTTVSKADLDSAGNTDDLVSRIADKSDYSETYVEGELRELCGVGVGAGVQQQRGQQRGGQQGSRGERRGNGQNRGQQGFQNETKAQRKARQRAYAERQPFGHSHGTTSTR